ncbi:hypothetical protein Pan97_37670 [Bremerella volcania]|uniref:Uncharacterized protein n=1 Tax=Bremerella volcania TaxID=2527984 RepID=A0A518CBW0_9BACT|nr:hypothetical protein Pan97_37670 [Bremerella volcania]
MADDRASLTAPDTLQNVNRNLGISIPRRHAQRANRMTRECSRCQKIDDENSRRWVNDQTSNFIGNRLNLAAAVRTDRTMMLRRCIRIFGVTTRCNRSSLKNIRCRTMHTTPPWPNCQQRGEDENQGWLKQAMHVRANPQKKTMHSSLSSTKVKPSWFS